MLYDTGYMKDGFTLIDVLISVAIIVMLFGGIYLIYFSIIDVINNIEVAVSGTVFWLGPNGVTYKVFARENLTNWQY